MSLGGTVFRIEFSLLASGPLCCVFQMFIGDSLVKVVVDKSRSARFMHLDDYGFE